MKKKKENLTGYLFILPAIILFLFFVLIPVIAMVCLGFTKYNLFSAPQWTGFSNFAKIFTDGRLWTVTKNTIFLAFFSVILNIVVGLFLALLIANKRSPVFNYLVRLFYFFPLIRTIGKQLCRFLHNQRMLPVNVMGRSQVSLFIVLL